MPIGLKAKASKKQTLDETIFRLKRVKTKEEEEARSCYHSKISFKEKEKRTIERVSFWDCPC